MIIEFLKNNILPCAATAAFAAIIAWVKNIQKQGNATKSGLQALLRTEIIRIYEKSVDQGYCPIYLKEAAEKAYTSYHELGGNGTITHLYEEIQSLPTERPE